MRKISCKIKICGITNKEDAMSAVTHGADMLGFILYPKSKRYISLKDAQKICKEIPKHITKVAVLVNEPLAQVKKIIKKNIFDTVQLHGDESPEYCDTLTNIQVFKAFRIAKKSDLAGIKKYHVDGYVLDTFHPDMFGGTGIPFDWTLAQEAKKFVSPIILSGGLTPKNVCEAIRMAKPYAVDVNSGVEKEPGKKDFQKMKRFIENVRKTSQINIHI